MNKKIKFGLGVILFFISFGVAQADLGPNLISNGSLENGTSVPTGWTTAPGANTNKTKFTYPTLGVDGAKAVRVDVTTYKKGDIFWTPPNIPVVAGKSYLFSSYYKSNVPTSIIVAYLNQSGSAISYVTLGSPVAAADWKYFSATTTVPTGATQVRIQYVIKKVGFVETDSYSLQELNVVSPSPTPAPPPTPVPAPAPTNPNLVQNGDFEKSNSGWSGDYWGKLTAKFTYPVAGKSSSKAAKVDVSNWKSGDAKWHFTHIPASTHTIYEWSEDYISTAITNVSLEFKMSNGSYVYQWLANAPISNNWSHIRGEVTVPVGAVSFTVLHSLVSNGSLTIDNVAVSALPDKPLSEGMVTLTFDDGLASQFSTAWPILKAASLKAGFYIITDAVGDQSYMTWANIKTLAAEGNEIGGHSRTHPDLSLLNSAQAQAEIQGSFDALKAQGLTPKSFVYPLGGVSPAVENLVQNAGYLVARGSYWGLNSPTADKYSLYDMRADKTTSAADVKKWIDQSLADKRWLIIELHDILPSSTGDEYSITQATFQSIVDYLKQKNVKVVTLEEGTKFIQ